MSHAILSLIKHKLFKKFIEREQLGTTDIDKGVAIPHIRATDIAKPMAIFIQLMTPVLYNESEAIRCHLILSLLVPEDNPDDHLNLLAYFTKQFHSGTIREQLSLCQQPETAVNIFAHAYELQNCSLISTTEPGVFVNVLNHGILLSGASGIGKSELALVLIRNGHQLIADDAVIFSKETQAEGNAILMGSCPPVTQNFLEIRGLGIVDVYELFGEKVIAPKKKLDLIIKLIRAIDDEHSQIDRIHGMYQEKKITWLCYYRSNTTSCTGTKFINLS